jgi:hypothetical protein
MFLIAEERGSTPLPPQPSRIERSVTASRFSSRFAPSLFCKKSQKLNPLFSNSSALFKKENSDNSFPTNHFCTLLQNTGSVPTPFFSVLPLLTIHDSRFTNSFRIRTSEKHARKPCRMRTSKTRGLKSFRIRSYKKTGEGVGCPLPLLRPPRARTSFRGTATSHSPNLSRRDGDNGPGAKSLVHCLSHGGHHLEHVRHSEPFG